MRGLAQAEHCDCLLLRAAGDVVIQIEPSNGFLRPCALARHLVRVFEEQVPGMLWLGPRRAQKTQIELGGRGQACRFRQQKIFRFRTRREKNGDPLYGQRARQPVHDRGEQFVEIGL